MSITTSRITPCLWFDGQAQQAAEHYTWIFPNSQMGAVTHYTKAGQEVHGHQAGSVLTVEFALDGQSFTALNGGPLYQFTEAISLQVHCDSQDEVDYYWERLSAGGDPASQQCGWLKDQFGVSWQIVPKVLNRLLFGGTEVQSEFVMGALMTMKKLDIAMLETAFVEA